MEKLITIPMNENKKYAIKEYREALYNEITKKRKEERKKWQQKYIK